MTLALLLTHQHSDDVAGAEYSDAEMRAAVEMLDTSDLESLIQQIYAANCGLH